MGSARAAKDGLGLQEDVACGKIGFLQSLEHCYESHSTNVAAVLMLGGERDRQKISVFHVIDSDYANLLRDTYSASGETLHDPSCGDVVGTDDCVGATVSKHGLQEVRVLWIADAYQILLLGELRARIELHDSQRFDRDGGGRETPGNEGNAFGSVEDEMLGDEKPTRRLSIPTRSYFERMGYGV